MHAVVPNILGVFDLFGLSVARPFRARRGETYRRFGALEVRLPLDSYYARQVSTKLMTLFKFERPRLHILAWAIFIA